MKLHLLKISSSTAFGKLGKLGATLTVSASLSLLSSLELGLRARTYAATGVPRRKYQILPSCFCSVPVTAGNKLVSKEVLSLTADIHLNRPVINNVPYWLLRELPQKHASRTRHCIYVVTENCFFGIKIIIHR
jgi:hypothetical protein